jgi:4-hydroxy-3-methylbut-2-enyl diphosphate reductase
MSLRKVLLVKPRGFCAGVVRAVDIVEEALKITQPVYVRKEIVHNKFVVDTLRGKGAIFVDDLEEIPDGTPGDPVVCIYSAHGVSPAVRARAKEKNLVVIDATCPLVTKVHLEAIRYAKSGYEIVLIGHPGHEEVEGTMGEAPYAMHLVADIADVEKLELPNSEKIVYLTQTTLSVDDTREVAEALKRKFPQMTQPPKDDICYATTNRQSAVKDLSSHCDLILVIGAQNSSNSQRLREVAEACGTPAHLIDDETSIQDAWIEGVETVGISAGASAPEILVERVIDDLKKRGAQTVETLETIPENVFFPLPKELKTLPMALSQN